MSRVLPENILNSNRKPSTAPLRNAPSKGCSPWSKELPKILTTAMWEKQPTNLMSFKPPGFFFSYAHMSTAPKESMQALWKINEIFFHSTLSSSPFLLEILSGLVFVLIGPSYWSVFVRDIYQCGLRKWKYSFQGAELSKAVLHKLWSLSQIWPLHQRPLFLDRPQAENSFYLFKGNWGRGGRFYVTETICSLQSLKYLLCSILQNTFPDLQS